MSRGRVTVKDIAREAGVTAQTVSRVFRNQGYLSEDTKKKVLEAAKLLNYVPNQTARSLRIGNEKSIAVVFDGLRNVYFSVMIDYLYREANRLGYALTTVFRAYEHEITEKVYLDVLSLGATAVVSFLEASPELGGAVLRYGVPVLVLGRRTNIPELDYVTTDDEKGGRLAAEKLISAGCKKFLYVAEGMGMTCVQDRGKGFIDALAAHGHSAKVIDINGGFTEQIAALEAEGFIPDGVFCFSDMIAFYVLTNLKGEKYASMKVVGYDDIGAEVPFPLRLTSVGVDKAEYTRYALGKLVAKIENDAHEELPIRERYDVFLHEGETA